ncbi:hypothetical protein B0T21DRAFT_281220 [Apiosordaria backusii]|uniref:Uncharacterized protein n=1 Tax=Apiosordaria backusii TaxID=314023 RepID=A0AA40ESI6_9PEZI|nr:hypothetical protein B0T21DRAFT_281220 [Apiosordaria backusii]
MLTVSSSQPTRQPARGVRRAHETDEVNLNSQCPNSFTTIKAAMAAGLGSSLFLFQGLSNISPRILTEASLPSPTFPSSPIYQEEQQQEPDSNMGNSESAVAKGSKSKFRLSRLSTTPATSSTAPAAASKRTKPEYKLRLICLTCTGKGLAENACMIANDINANGGSNLAFQDGSSYCEEYALKTWKLEIDCCGWSKTQKAGTDMIEKYMKSAEERRRPISVDEVLVKLEENGIAHRSNVKKKVYKPRGQEAQRQAYYPSQQQQQQQQQQQYQNQQHNQVQPHPQPRTRQGWGQQSWHQGAEYQYPGRR